MSETSEAKAARGKVYYWANKEKILSKNRAWRLANLDRSLELSRKSNRKASFGLHLKERYNMTVEQFAKLADNQNERCAICGHDERLTVDHDHESGLVRGLLCGSCNRAIGLFGENTESLKSAIRYLEQARQSLEA